MSRRKSHLTSRKNKQTKYKVRRAKLRREKRQHSFCQATQTLLDGELSSAYEHELDGASHVFNNTGEEIPFPDLQFTLPHVDKDCINVLSLFDGIGSGLYVLQRVLGLQVGNYYSSEIDANAIRVLKHNFGEKAICLGPIENITIEKLKALGKIDLILGSSPCSELSRVNWRRKGLNDKSGSGYLFFEFVRILNFFKELSNTVGEPLWFFENTFNMDRESKQQISSALKCEPVVRCCSDFVPMPRKRFYWSNIKKMGSHDGTMKCRLNLQHYIQPYMTALVERVPTLTTSVSAQRSGATKILPVEFNGKPEYLTPVDYERLLGFESHYTDCGLTHTARLKLLGKSWSIHVVSSLLYPLSEMFRKAT